MTPSSFVFRLLRSGINWLFKKYRLQNMNVSADAIAQAKIAEMEEILEEIHDAADTVDGIHQGLEDLKLGSIGISYSIFINGVLAKSAGGGGGHLIAEGSIIGGHTITYIEAYVSRGYRTHWDHDSTQGRGVAGVMGALSSYATYPW